MEHPVVDLKQNVERLRQEQNFRAADVNYHQGYSDALNDVLALFTNASTLKLDSEDYLWKWVERAMFDKKQGIKACVETLAFHPAAPWNKGRWDVDHKLYASEFYAMFPKAKEKVGDQA